MAPNRVHRLALSLGLALGFGISTRPSEAGPIYSAARFTFTPSRDRSVDPSPFQPDTHRIRWGGEPAGFVEPSVGTDGFPGPEPAADAEPWSVPSIPRPVAFDPPAVEHAPNGLARVGRDEPGAIGGSHAQLVTGGEPDQAADLSQIPAVPLNDSKGAVTLVSVEDGATSERGSHDVDAAPDPVTDHSDRGEIAGSPTTTTTTPTESLSPHAGPSHAVPAEPAATTDGMGGSGDRVELAPAGSDPGPVAGDAAVLRDRGRESAITLDQGAMHDLDTHVEVTSLDRDLLGEGRVVGESVIQAISGVERTPDPTVEGAKLLDVHELLQTAIGVELARSTAIADAGRILDEPDYQTSWDAAGAGGAGNAGVSTPSGSPSLPTPTPEPSTWILFAALCLPLMYRARRAAASRPAAR